MKKVALFFLTFAFLTLYAENSSLNLIVKEFENAKPKKEENAKSISISEFLFGGKYIILSDGSTWQVYPSDRVKILGWIGVDNIEIKPSSDPQYNMVLINPSTEDRVLVKKASVENIKAHKRSFQPPAEETQK